MRLLVVEDEAKTANFLAKGLGESGFAVDVALNGLDGRYFIEQQEYDLIILDVMLPGLNGWQLLQLIRQRGATPVLVDCDAYGQIDVEAAARAVEHHFVERHDELGAPRRHDVQRVRAGLVADAAGADQMGSGWYVGEPERAE